MGQASRAHLNELVIHCQRAVGAAADRVRVRRRRVRRGLVDDVDHLGVGVALAELGHPRLDLGLADAAARLLAAPHERVLLEDDVVLHAVVVDRVERAPVEGSRRARLDRTPLARVFGRDLVPVLREDLAVGVDGVAGGDVAHELERALVAAAADGAGNAGAAASARCTTLATPARRVRPAARRSTLAAASARSRATAR